MVNGWPENNGIPPLGVGEGRTVKWRWWTVVGSALLWLATTTAWAQDRFDHAVWDGLLRTHVQARDGGRATVVDYAGMAADRDRLRQYLASLSSISAQEFAAWPDPDRLAWLINAYNAWTVELILERWPDLDSIRDLGSLLRSPWRRSFIPLLGETVSLDDIEHAWIRGQFVEPRIHFAVNCASIGCPALRPEAYVAERLESQLEDATRKFLADRTRNRVEDGRVWVSEIFKWYRQDFEAGWQGATSMGQFLARYGDAIGLAPADRQRLADGDMPIRHLDYDWRLNAAP